MHFAAHQDRTGIEGDADCSIGVMHFASCIMPRCTFASPVTASMMHFASRNSRKEK